MTIRQLMRSVSGATAAARDGPRASLADIARALGAALDADKFPVFQTALALRDGKSPAPALMERATRALGVGHMASNDLPEHLACAGRSVERPRARQRSCWCG